MKTAFLIFFCFLLSGAIHAQYNVKPTGVADTVKVGAYVIGVHDINFHDKEYTIRFWLWFLYTNPNFNFGNQLDIPNAKSIDPPEIIVDSLDGKAWVIMKMKCVMKEHWNVEDFPFDGQVIKVKIENTLFDHNSLIFAADKKGSEYDHLDAVDGWTITKFNVSVDKNDYKTGFGDSRPGKESSLFSQFKIEMNLERNAWGLFMKIFVGMYISFLIAAISFTPHPSELEPRFGLPVGGLFAAVGNKYIIDSLLPESSSFTLVDTLHTVTFFGILAILIVSAIALKFHEADKTAMSLKVNRMGAWIVVSLYILTNILFIELALQ